MVLRMQPRSEQFFTLISKAGLNVVESAAMLTECVYARGMELSFPRRRGSLFDMAYAALAEQARTTMWTVDERFYNGARAQSLGYVMHPGRDPLP
jgi:predicted nucleic acid-binding protein